MVFVEMEEIKSELDVNDFWFFFVFKEELKVVLFIWICVCIRLFTLVRVGKILVDGL